MLVFEDLGFLLAICMYPQIGCKQKMPVDTREAALNISMPLTLTLFLAIWPMTKWLSDNYSCHLLFALSLKYDIFVYLLKRTIMLEKDNFHHLVFENTPFPAVPYFFFFFSQSVHNIRLIACYLVPDHQEVV